MFVWSEGMNRPSAFLAAGSPQVPFLGGTPGSFSFRYLYLEGWIESSQYSCDFSMKLVNSPQGFHQAQVLLLCFLFAGGIGLSVRGGDESSSSLASDSFPDQRGVFVSNGSESSKIRFAVWNFRWTTLL